MRPGTGALARSDETIKRLDPDATGPRVRLERLFAPEHLAQESKSDKRRRVIQPRRIPAPERATPESEGGFVGANGVGAATAVLQIAYEERDELIPAGTGIRFGRPTTGLRVACQKGATARKRETRSVPARCR